MIVGAWLTALLCLLIPAFSVAAVFLLPLFLCPLAGSKKEAWAYPAALAALLLGALLFHHPAAELAKENAAGR